MRYLYDNGLPFSDVLARNLDWQFERIEKKRASLAIIDGPVGTGKTTLAVHAMDYSNNRINKPETVLEIKDHPQLALGGKEFSGHFRQCYKLGLPVVTYDEAGDFSRRGAITQFNRTLNRLFETYRGFKILVILCLPNFNILDQQLFDNQIPRMLIHITSRSLKYGTYKGYSLSGMGWLRYWFDKLPKGSKHKCYSKVEPNFYGHFLNLPPAREKALDKLSTYGKERLLKRTEIDMKGLYDYMQLSHSLNRSICWVRNNIREMKIKHSALIDRKKFFDKDTLSALAGKIEDARMQERAKA